MTNPSDYMDITTSYNRLASLARQIPKHNLLVIGRDKND